MTRVVILGAGVMGSAMALPFSDRGWEVHLVGTHLDEAIIASIKATGHHPKLNAALPSPVKAFQATELPSAIDGADLVLLGVASAGVGWAIAQLQPLKRRPALMITKGMHPDGATMRTFPDVVADALDIPAAAIAGPCIAGELAVRRTTATVIVSHNRPYAEQLCASLATGYDHPRPSIDMTGVELCAAFKNFYAIAVGWAQGALDVLPEPANKARNNNPAAVLFAQAVRELMILAKAMGGEAESVWGPAGVGDLYVTCQAGRNSRLGNHLGRGLAYAEVKAGPMKHDTIEGAELGIACASTLRAMMQRCNLPLAEALLDTLVDAKPFSPDWEAFHQ